MIRPKMSNNVEYMLKLFGVDWKPQNKMDNYLNLRTNIEKNM